MSTLHRIAFERCPCLPCAAQPENIYEFGAQYFSELLAASAPKEPTVAAFPEASAVGEGDELAVKKVAEAIDIKKLTPAELEPIILRECAAGAGVNA